MVRAAMMRIPWIVFALMLLFAILYVTGTVSELPALVASHFDGTGSANAYMTRSVYTGFVLTMGVAFPIALVALLSVVFSVSKDMKLPNRDYWLAPERIVRTRSRLVAYGVWFGSLMVAMACYVHWLILGAHRNAPPHLANQSFGTGLFVFFLITGVWIIALRRAFRLPRGTKR
jgi:uncharacterized membrane protein